MTVDTQPGKYLTAEAILASDDVQESDLTVPEWGGKVHLRGLTLGEVMDIRKASGTDERQVIIGLFTAAIVQPRLTADQADHLMAKSASATQRVLIAINTMNGQDALGQFRLGQSEVTFRPGPNGQDGNGIGPGPGDDQGQVAAGDADG